MKPYRVLALMLLLALTALWWLRTTGAEFGTLQCLRSGQTNQLGLCLSCHDGSLASNIKPSLPTATRVGAGRGHSAPRNPRAVTSGEHPVPVNYAEAYSRHPMEFVPPGSLDPRLQLVQGEVQCVTCHRSNAQGQWLPLQLSGGRPLCLGCHRK